MSRPAPHPVDDKGRLAPSFVEWMQNFPEGWTEGMSRTQALKALGNAVVPQQATLALAILGSGESNAAASGALDPSPNELLPTPRSQGGGTPLDGGGHRPWPKGMTFEQWIGSVAHTEESG